MPGSRDWFKISYSESLVGEADGVSAQTAKFVEAIRSSKCGIYLEKCSSLPVPLLVEILLIKREVREIKNQ